MHVLQHLRQHPRRVEAGADGLDATDSTSKVLDGCHWEAGGEGVLPRIGFVNPERLDRRPSSASAN